MMKRINIIIGLNELIMQIKVLLETFPALKYLLTLILAILSIFSVSIPWLSGVLLFLLFGVIFRFKPLLLFTVASSIYLWTLETEINQMQSANYPTQNQEITVRLTDLKIVDPQLLNRRTVSYLADVVESKVDFPAQIMVSFYNPPVLHRGAILRIKGKLVTRGVKIPGSFDYFQYLRQKKVGGIFYAKEVIEMHAGFDWFRGIEYLRNLVLKKVTMGYEHGSAQWRIITGIVVGEKRNLTYDDRQRFVTSGIFHIFAVSGMHVALVALLLFYLLGFLRVPYRFRLTISPVILLLYVLMTGASASSLRAFGMLAIWWIGQLVFRSSNLYYLLALCALLQLLFTPLLLYDAGFQFSFLIVFFLIRGIEIKKRVKLFFWFEQNLAVNQRLSFKQRTISILFDLLYIGSLIFLAAFGLQMYYFQLIQPFTILSAVWSGFCASGIMLFSLIKVFFTFEFLNPCIDFFLIPLETFSQFIFSQELFSYVKSSSYYFVLFYYLFLGLALFIRRVWLVFVFLMITWLVVVFQTSDSVEIYYANIKGSHVVACVNEGNRSAIVYVNGRSTQSALSRLLSSKRIKTIAQLWLGNDYTPTWQLGSRFEVKSKAPLSQLNKPIRCLGFKVVINQNRLSITTTEGKTLELSLDDIVPNEFHLVEF